MRADYSIIAKAKKDGLEVVIRCPHSSFSVVEDFWASKERERIVWLPVSQCWRTKKFVKEQDLAEEIQVRLLRVSAQDRRGRSVADDALRCQAISATGVLQSLWNSLE